ncbi:MAG: hypothetical protein PHH06_03245 [Candidatus Gracilibacteria bacterium]|nr:hypothetical protein [Candidatus Gracilibacteria bacterium]
MANKKREKNMVILSFILSIIVFIILLLLSLYVYKEVLKVQETKSDFNKVLNSYNSIKKKGLSYDDFTVLIKRKNFESEDLLKELNDEYTASLLEKIDKNFYDSSFINTGNVSYIKFLENTKTQIEESNIKEDYIAKEKQILSILPMYVSEGEFYTEDGLTDFKFINYIENLLRKFNLVTSSSIGISEIKLVSNNLKSEKDINLQDSGVYYTPLKLNLVGTKANILKFLNYVNQVGSVIEENGDIIIKDNNQITEITSVKMKYYIDDSNLIDKKDLLDLIINGTQSNDKYEIEAELNFYVVGVPLYKIKEEVEKVIGKTSKEKYNYYVLESSVQQKIEKLLNTNDRFYLNNLDKINTYLGTIKKDIITISGKVNKGENLEKEFKKVLEYKDIFLLIERELNDISNKLNLK